MPNTPSSQSVYKAYNRASHTVGKTRQVVMLYDGAIRFLKQAREDMVAGNIEGRFNKLVRVGEIIMGLQSCLDFDSGGESAKVLYSFYSGIDMRIISLHRTNSVEVCDQVINDLKEMRDVWDKIDRGDATPNAMAATTSEPETPPASVDPITVSA